MIQGGGARGQTKTYLTGNKTGNRVQAGSLIGLGVGTAGLSAPMATHQWSCLLGVQTNQFRFFYGDNTILTSTTTTASAVTITASRNFGLLGVLGSGADTYIQFRNTGNANIAANTPTYFKLGEKPTNTGLSVGVGKLLGLIEMNGLKGMGYSSAGSYVLNTATLGFLSCPNPYNGNENIGSPAGTEAGTTTKLLIDQSGDWYAKVTPNAQYNAVRLSMVYPPDLEVANVNTEIKANVYHAFTMAEGEACNTRPYFTSPGEASGINLVTESLGIPLNQLVSNPHQAIDGNASTYSSLSTGVVSLGVASTLGQTFYFDHTASSSDAVTFNLGLTRSLIDLNLLGKGVTFRFYNNDTEVGSSRSLRDLLLDLNLLQLITVEIGATQTSITLKPSVSQPFNKVAIQYETGLVNANVIGEPLKIYEVSLSPSAPTFTTPLSDSLSICSSNTASLNATTASGTTLVWYENASGGTALTANADGSYTTPVLTANKTYYVSAKKCSAESTRVPVNVLVNPLPSITPGGNISICQGVDNCNIPYTSATETPTAYRITWNNAAVTAGMVNDTNYKPITPNELSITIPDDIAAATYNGTITVKNANECTKAIPFSVTVHTKPGQTVISSQ